MVQLVVIRHGESIWNCENRFTGWTDIDLSERGIEESKAAGKLLKKEFTFDVAYTSVLRRSIKSLWIILDEMDLTWIPVYKTWRLNEKYYGALQGLNKREMAEKFGEKQVHLWRRSYDVRPPAVEKADFRYLARDPKYKEIGEENLPVAECLKDTVERFLPFWNQQIVPELKSGKRVIICAHGNSLRALVKHLEDVPDDEIMDVDVPTGIPIIYELDENLKPMNKYFLGDTHSIQRAIEKVRNQGMIKKDKKESEEKDSTKIAMRS